MQYKVKLYLPATESIVRPKLISFGDGGAWFLVGEKLMHETEVQILTYAGMLDTTGRDIPIFEFDVCEVTYVKPEEQLAADEESGSIGKEFCVVLRDFNQYMFIIITGSLVGKSIPSNLIREAEYKGNGIVDYNLTTLIDSFYEDKQR